MAEDLAQKKCVPCEGGVPPFTGERAEEYLAQLPEGWKVAENKLEKVFPFKDFAQAMAFANRVGEVAEAEGHHPDLKVSYGSVTVELFTHAVGGLSENDFIVAAKIERM